MTLRELASNAVIAAALIIGGEGIVFPASGASAADCREAMSTEALSAGISKLKISAPCRANEKFKVRYDSVEFARVLDNKGEATLTIDCFLGETPGLTVSFETGQPVSVPLKTLDLDRVSKVAAIWKGSINLDLHAFEYAASMSEAGHIWAGAPSTRWEVEERMKKEGRGHGFISFSSDGTGGGDQLEVYTFVHQPGQSSGAVRIALDYESRSRLPQDPDTCGTGLYADVDYKVVVRYQNGRVSRSRGSFAALECNKVPDLLARFNSKSMPQLLLAR